MLSKDNSTSQHNQTEIKALLSQINEKQLQLEEARKRDLVFEKVKVLFLEIKVLNHKLQEYLQEQN